MTATGEARCITCDAMGCMAEWVDAEPKLLPLPGDWWHDERDGRVYCPDCAVLKHLPVGVRKATRRLMGDRAPRAFPTPTSVLHRRGHYEP